MSDFGARLRNNLEPVLAMADPCEKISAYHDMPYAIFHYDPEQELPLRREVSSLQTRLENKGKRITRISKTINEQIPTHTVIFDVSTDRVWT